MLTFESRLIGPQFDILEIAFIFAGIFLNGFAYGQYVIVAFSTGIKIAEGARVAHSFSLVLAEVAAIDLGAIESQCKAFMDRMRR